MSILELMVILMLIGVGLWAINTYIPMDPTIKKIMNVVVVACVIIGLLQIFGVFEALRAFRVPHA